MTAPLHQASERGAFWRVLGWRRPIDWTTANTWSCPHRDLVCGSVDRDDLARMVEKHVTECVHRDSNI